MIATAGGLIIVALLVWVVFSFIWIPAMEIGGIHK
jgi:hypothetical protein